MYGAGELADPPTPSKRRRVFEALARTPTCSFVGSVIGMDSKQAILVTSIG